MDQKSYLAQALWHYRSTDKFTDIDIVCKDGTLSAHVALLSPFFASLGLKFSSIDDVPDFLFLPDLAKRDVEDDLKKIYSGHKAIILLDLFRSVKDIVKLEISDYVDEVESKPLENEKPDLKETLHDDDDYDFGVHDDIGQSDNEANDPDYFDKKDIKEDFPEPGGLKKEKPAKRVSSSQRSKMVECKECGDECHGMVAYLAHMKEFHAKTKIDQEGGNVCPYCEKVLKNNWLLRCHLALVHREELLKHHPYIVLTKPCPDCDEMFLGVTDLDKHTRTAHSKSSIEWNCQFCGEKFDKKGSLRIHRRNMHPNECLEAGIKSIFDTKQCPYCETKSNSNSALKQHIYTVHKDKRADHPEIQATHFCDECGQEFYGKQLLTQHIHRYHTENSYCKICYRFFPSPAVLEEHTKKEHSKPEIHICDICSQEFDKKAKLRSHQRTHKNTEYKFICPYCKGKNGKIGKNAKYQRKETLDQHIEEVHSGKEYICSQCPMVFYTPWNRSLHEKNIHAEKTIKCEQCDMMFSTNSYKNAHVRKVHVLEAEWICAHCGDSFRHKTIYEAHVNRHLNIRPHACDMCGKTFLIEMHLKRHMKTHTLPYHCDQCDVRVGSLDLLKEHVRIVHEGVHLECR